MRKHVAVNSRCTKQKLDLHSIFKRYKIPNSMFSYNIASLFTTTPNSYEKLTWRLSTQGRRGYIHIIA